LGCGASACAWCTGASIAVELAADAAAAALVIDEMD
jgi:hypothetical protein